MKSLQESLFDSKTQTTESLFDSDIITRDLNFGDLWRLELLNVREGDYFSFHNTAEDTAELIKKNIQRE